MNGVPMGDLARQMQSVRDETDQAIAGVLDSGWYVLGNNVGGFEEEFADFVGARHAIGVANGAQALYLSLCAADVGPDDEVITVANACSYQLAAILESGATPVFVDTDDDHVMSPTALEEAITPQTRAVMPVHLYGRLAPMNEIRDIAERSDLVVIEDAAQAHGSSTLDRRSGERRSAGTWGAMACFSFYPSKNLGAIGDGGAVTTDDDALAERLRRLRMYGWSEKYVVGEVGGRNSRLDELQAAMLRVRLRHLAQWNEMRRERAGWYRDLIDAPGLVLPSDEEGHVYHLFVVESTDRDSLRSDLASRSIGSDVHYPVPAHRQPIVAERFADLTLPRTERASIEVVSLPMFPELTRAEIEMVSVAVNEIVKIAPPNTDV
jgi:dTDP-4-amino-4,6-dideoxygalactose transaminase